ncbi:MAG TPA: CocE/NonD family hydrolase [Candidatus Thermoplasmatota archaeon]|nr:CocE/NonD family hydrolase [Candidatus Thermoplasmatota archaeon]
MEWRLPLIAALALVLPGCLTLPAAELDPAGATLAAADVPSYLRDVSQPIKGLTPFTAVLEHLPIAAPDGILLDTWVVRPEGDGPFPLVLEVTPYYEGGPLVIPELQQHGLNRAMRTLLERGYAVGVTSVRGTGNSGGCFTQGGPEEARDTAAVIEELAAQPWSNGNVGLIGVSYPGTTPQDVWIEAPPALKTIVPISGISDFYKYNFVNGVPIFIQGLGFNTYYWGMVGLGPQGTNFLLDPLALPGAIAGEACQDQLAVQEAGVSSTLDGNKDAYWLARDFRLELEAAGPRERASVFYIHGLQDWNVKPHMMEDWLDAVWDTGVPVKVWIGQWGHNWPQRADWFELTMVAWFDHFLKGVDTGILDAPAVQVQDDDEMWRHEARWPPQDVEWVTLHPGEGGTLGAAPGSGEASYSTREGLAVGSVDILPVEMVAWESEPLLEDWHLAGQPVFEANVTASARRAALILTLAERTAGGELRPFNFAAMSLNHVASLEKGQDDIGGQTQQVRVRFFPQDDVVKKGSTLVLIAALNVVRNGQPAPALEPITDPGTITISLDGASLALPLDRTIVYEEPQPEKPE